MKESSKILIGLGLGLVAGGTAGYFLASEKGQKFQKKTKKKLKKIQNDIKDQLIENAEVASNKLESATAFAKAWVKDASKATQKKVTETTDTVEEFAEDLVDEVQTDLKEGMDNARKKVNMHLQN